jgi:hypothetical protein
MPAVFHAAPRKFAQAQAAPSVLLETPVQESSAGGRASVAGKSNRWTREIVSREIPDVTPTALPTEKDATHVFVLHLVACPFYFAIA